MNFKLHKNFLDSTVLVHPEFGMTEGTLSPHSLSMPGCGVSASLINCSHTLVRREPRASAVGTKVQGQGILWTSRHLFPMKAVVILLWTHFFHTSPGIVHVSATPTILSRRGHKTVLPWNTQTTRPQIWRQAARLSLHARPKHGSGTGDSPVTINFLTSLLVFCLALHVVIIENIP